MQSALIDYKYSPTGKAYVAQYKAPFRPNERGYGYYGVLIQDENREVVECSSCGKWLKWLSPAHLKKCSGMNHREYKMHFGLNLGTALCSDEFAKKRREVYYSNEKRLEKMEEQQKKENVGDPKKGQEKYISEERKNNKGSCNLQLLTRTVEFIKANGVLPSSRNRGKNLYSAVARRFGRFPIALKLWGLPYYHGGGSRYTYIFPDDSIIDINHKRTRDREVLFEMIMEKCPVMKAEDLKPFNKKPQLQVIS